MAVCFNLPLTFLGWQSQASFPLVEDPGQPANRQSLLGAPEASRKVCCCCIYTYFLFILVPTNETEGTGEYPVWPYHRTVLRW